MKWVFDLSPHFPFQIKTTEAPSYLLGSESILSV